MRSCIYCGRELEKGEVCSCPQSAAHRAQKQSAADGSQSGKTKQSSTEGERTTYRTGYTGHQSRFDRARERRRVQRDSAKKRNASSGTVTDFIKGFIKSPVDRIINPPSVGRLAMLVIAAAEGAVAWLGMFFLYAGIRGGVFEILGKLLGFKGIEGYSVIAKMILCSLAGAVSGIILFFLYTGVFWMINRFIFRSKTAYWDFSTRLSLIGIPFTVFGIIGVVFSVFSLRTLMLFLVCGLISSIILMYEALRTEWINRSPSAVMYAMLAGLFVMFSFLYNLIRI